MSNSKMYEMYFCMSSFEIGCTWLGEDFGLCKFFRGLQFYSWNYYQWEYSGSWLPLDFGLLMVVLHIIDGLTLHIGFAWLQSKYKHFPRGYLMPLKINQMLLLLICLTLVDAASLHRHMLHWTLGSNSLLLKVSANIPSGLIAAEPMQYNKT